MRNTAEWSIFEGDPDGILWLIHRGEQRKVAALRNADGCRLRGYRADVPLSSGWELCDVPLEVAMLVAAYFASTGLSVLWALAVEDGTKVMRCRLGSWRMRPTATEPFWSPANLASHTLESMAAAMYGRHLFMQALERGAFEETGA